MDMKVDVTPQQRISYNYEINHGRKAEITNLQTQEHSGVRRAGIMIEGMTAQTPRGVVA